MTSVTESATTRSPRTGASGASGVSGVSGAAARAALAVALLGLVPCAGAAQLRPEDPVRVRHGHWAPPTLAADDGWVEGRVVGLDADTLRLRIGRHVVVAVPLDAPPEVELRGDFTHRAGRGALIGGGIGFAIGAAMASVDEVDPQRFPDTEDDFLDDGEVGRLVGSTLLGTALGAFVGWHVREYDWIAVEPRPAHDTGRGAALRDAGPSRGPVPGLAVSVRIPVGGGG